MDDAKQAQAILKGMAPKPIATSAAGFSMKAKINGKAWTATTMMPPDAAGGLIGHGKAGDYVDYISMPYDRRFLVVGRTTKFGEGRGTLLVTNDDIATWGGRVGEMQITKVDATSAEGTFFFTATSSETTKKVEVTEGSFRILLRKN